MAITPDADNSVGAAFVADSQSRGDYLECQKRQASALGVLRALIRAGALKLDKVHQ